METPATEWISAENTGLTAPLTRMIDRIGRQLSRVVRQLAGDTVFGEIVDLQRRCREAAASDDPSAAGDLARRISALDMDRIFWIGRAYTVFFHLLNEAERQEITRINHEAERQETEAAPRSDAIREAVFALKQQGLSAEEAAAVVGNLDILPTLTAHPTEARRGSVLFKQNRFADLLSRLSLEERLGTMEKRRLTEQIAHEIALMMVTDDVRSDRLRAEDEVGNGIYYQTHAIWTAVPRIFRDLSQALTDYYGSDVAIPPFLRYRSWIGGDRDGNPFVTCEVTRYTLVAHRMAALKNYRRELEDLWQDLSVSSLRVAVPDPLRRDIEEASHTAALDTDYLHRHRREPFRLKIAYMIARIEELMAAPESVTYTPGDFRADLKLIEDSLSASGLAPLTSLRSLWALGVRSRVFGFHLAALDIRQHSRVHESAVAELLAGAGVTDAYQSLSETDKLAVLEAELINPRPLAGLTARLSPPTTEILEVMKLIAETVARDPDAIGSYVVSMTHTVCHLLEVLVLAKEAGIWRIDGDRVETSLDLVPLFETITDLEQAELLMTALFNHRLYGRHLAARDNFQEIMLGYSDSNKDGGYWMANRALHHAQERLSRVCRDHGVRFRFFHGRGGSAGRGGGRANQAIFAMPVESRNGSIRFTEQGEIISFRYARPAIARRHLEQIVNAMMKTACDTRCDAGCSPRMQEMMAWIATGSMAAYRRLIDNGDFWDWFLEITPIEHIGRLPIASRPVSRTSASAATFDDLRAIPWVFSWTQTRYNLPGWFGAGRFLARAISDNPETLPRLQEMWREWPFFRTVVSNVELELARTRMNTAKAYSRLSERSFHDSIETEYKATCAAILQITGKDHLLVNHPAIRDTIAFRNPYSDLLNLIQVDLLKRWRALDDEKAAGELRHALFLTINGIAAAMQSTG